MVRKLSFSVKCKLKWNIMCLKIYLFSFSVVHFYATVNEWKNVTIYICTIFKWALCRRSIRNLKKKMRNKTRVKNLFVLLIVYSFCKRILCATSFKLLVENKNRETKCTNYNLHICIAIYNMQIFPMHFTALNINWKLHFFVRKRIYSISIAWTVLLYFISFFE